MSQAGAQKNEEMIILLTTFTRFQISGSCINQTFHSLKTFNYRLQGCYKKGAELRKAEGLGSDSRAGKTLFA